jgi:formiminotetrahydrofolate cyclodeaminase
MLDPAVTAALHELVDAFDGPAALPAGGGAGISALAIGTALAGKILRIASRRTPELNASVGPLAAMLARVRPEFEADCRAFANVLAASRDPEARDDRIEDAWRAATEVPVRVARHAVAVAHVLERAADHVAGDLRADLDAALVLVRAGHTIAVRIARENAEHLAPGAADAALADLPAIDHPE